MTKNTLVWGIGGLLVFCAVAGAQDLADLTVKDVRVEGLRRASEQLVQSKIEVQPGQKYNPRAVARDIRRLYELGFFMLIKADVERVDGGVTLTYIVQEKRVIDEIRIIGNSKLRDRQLRGKMSWREGDSFMTEEYDEERDAILGFYQSKGFPNARVDIVVEEVGPSRVKIIYMIDEGKKARIRRIQFVGNDAISNWKLKRIMKTRRAWLRFFGGKFDEEKFEDDIENILDAYGDRGRLEARVADTNFEYTNGGKGLELTVRLDEGPEYRVGELDIVQNFVFDDDEALRLLEVQPGDVHNKSQVEKDAALVTKGYSDSGYVDAMVTPLVTLDRENKTTHLVHKVEEGELKYLRQINITGNYVTRDDVIRREILLLPGERFDGALMEASRRRLDATEYFDSVRFRREDVEGNDMFADLAVDVEEGKTSWWNFGFGYSTDDAFDVYSELRFRNFDIANWPTFGGGGQQLRLKLDVGTRRNQYFLSFTDPEIGGYPFAFGFDIFDERYAYEGGAEYTEETRGAQVRLGKILSPLTSVRTSLRYRNVDISDYDRFGSRFSPYEKLRGGDTTISSIWGISRNSVDSKRDPASGSKHDFQFELAGIGGDNKFVKLEHDSTWYRPMPFGDDNEWVLSLRTREGWAMPYGSSEVVPLSDRFWAGGGTTVRGFKNRDIGPTAQRFLFFGDEDRIGGELRLITNIELKYRITDIFRVYAFSDAGSVWEEPSDFDPGDLKFSVGLGMGMDIPRMGPVRIDYGYPLNADGDQGSGRLHLQTGIQW